MEDWGPGGVAEAVGAAGAAIGVASSAAIGVASSAAVGLGAVADSVIAVGCIPGGIIAIAVGWAITIG